jgi:hypothetical protein
VRVALAVLVAVGLAGVLPRGAEACSRIAPPPALEGYPRDGSVDVPTDVIPVFESFRAGTSGGVRPGAVFELRTDAGDTIALTPRERHAGHFELVPASPLAARTRYTLRGLWTATHASLGEPIIDVSLSFTTAEGPLAQPPAPPEATMQHYTAPRGGSSCSPEPRGTCISFTGEELVEFMFDDGLNDPELLRAHPGVHGPYLSRRGFMGNLTGVNQGTSFQCVQLRTRAANGIVSDKVVLCGADAPHYALPGVEVTCGPGGLRYQGRPAAEFPLQGASGCTFGGARSRGSAANIGLVLAALAAVAGLRARRRR